MKRYNKLLLDSCCLYLQFVAKYLVYTTMRYVWVLDATSLVPLRRIRGSPNFRIAFASASKHSGSATEYLVFVDDHTLNIHTLANLCDSSELTSVELHLERSPVSLEVVGELICLIYSTGMDIYNLTGEKLQHVFSDQFLQTKYLASASNVLYTSTSTEIYPWILSPTAKPQKKLLTVEGNNFIRGIFVSFEFIFVCFRKAVHSYNLRDHSRKHIFASEYSISSTLRFTKDRRMIMGRAGDLTSWSIDSGRKTNTFILVPELEESNYGECNFHVHEEFLLAHESCTGKLKMWNHRSGELIFYDTTRGPVTFRISSDKLIMFDNEYLVARDYRRKEEEPEVQILQAIPKNSNKRNRVIVLD
eukprot:TRINITY_DN10078_c0_g1_i1.p1 TRINITY_DN10078_c0_g1~~TRINITY_DN10078_c0_g1_i1.p1  ORF type:complete len:360 (+),score=61.09 TRINITY_DN10078_c0_g1_i1:395-1474(+)